MSQHPRAGGRKSCPRSYSGQKTFGRGREDVKERSLPLEAGRRHGGGLEASVWRPMGLSDFVERFKALAVLCGV